MAEIEVCESVPPPSQLLGAVPGKAPEEKLLCGVGRKEVSPYIPEPDMLTADGTTRRDSATAPSLGVVNVLSGT